MPTPRVADRADDLRRAIDRVGYYPAVVADAVEAALAGRGASSSFVIHHEPTFDQDEVRRHVTVLVLTPIRVIVAHTDEHPPDDLLPEPYASTTTEAVPLARIGSVAVTRMVANPASAARAPWRAPVTEAVLTVGWGAVRRLDLEPATCGDPDCVADHGYTGTLAAEDFALRISSSADGPEAVEAAARSSPRRSSAATVAILSSPRSSPAVLPRYGAGSLADVCCQLRWPRSAHPGWPTALDLPPSASYVVFLVDGLGWNLLRAHRRRRALPVVARRREPASDLRSPVDDRHQPDQPRHRSPARRARRRRLHLAHPRHGPPARRAAVGLRRRPARVAAARDGLRACSREWGDAATNGIAQALYSSHPLEYLTMA